MATLIGLLGYAAAAMLLAPQTLTRGNWRVRRPQLALGLWLGAFLTGVAALLGSLGWGVVLALGLYRQSAHPDGVIEAIALTVFAWSALAVTGAIVALALTRSEPLNEQRRHTTELVQIIAGAATYRTEQYRRIPVRFVTCSTPLATGIRGEEPSIVISSCLDEALTRPELAAVIEHERAHLIYHHAGIAHLARLNRLCLPSFFGAREFERATFLLIELIADDRAAAAHGRHALRGALEKTHRLAPTAALALRALRIGRPPRAASWRLARSASGPQR